MSIDLDELYERLEFCRQKVLQLNSEIISLGRGAVKCWVEPLGYDNGIVNAELLNKPPVSLRSEIGMLVNEQRSILDALACTLARRNGANDVSGVYFPITKTKSVQDEKVTKIKVKKISQQDRETIATLKPWGGSDDEQHSTYFLLHEADRVRKHQKLLEWACVGGVSVSPINGIATANYFSTHGAVFKNVGQVLKLAEFAEINGELRAEFQLVYTEPAALNGRVVSYHLHQFNEAVQTALDLFA